MIIEGLYLGNFQAVMNTERLRRLVSFAPITAAVLTFLIFLEHITCTDPSVPNTNRVRVRFVIYVHRTYGRPQIEPIQESLRWHPIYQLCSGAAY